MDRKDEKNPGRRVPKKRLSSPRKNESSSNSDSENPPLKRQVKRKFTVFALRKDNENIGIVSDTNSNLNDFGATRKIASESQGRQSMAGTPESEPVGSSSSETHPKPPSRHAIAARISRLRREQHLSKLGKKYVDLVQYCSELLTLVDGIRDQITDLRQYLLVLYALPTHCVNLRKLIILVVFLIRILFFIMDYILRHVACIMQRRLDPNLIAQEHPSNSHHSGSKVQNDVYMGHTNYEDPNGDHVDTDTNEQSHLNFPCGDDFSFEHYLTNEDNFNFGFPALSSPTEELLVPDVLPTVANLTDNSEPCLHIGVSGGSAELCSVCSATANSKESHVDDPSKQL